MTIQALLFAHSVTCRERNENETTHAVSTCDPRLATEIVFLVNTNIACATVAIPVTFSENEYLSLPEAVKFSKLFVGLLYT